MYSEQDEGGEDENEGECEAENPEFRSPSYLNKSLKQYLQIYYYDINIYLQI